MTIELTRRHFLTGSALTGTALTFPHGRPATAPSPIAQVRQLPAGFALVTSLRLPLAGIAAESVAPLIQGDVSNWTEVGAPVSRPIVPMMLAGIQPDGMTPTETADTVDALATAMDAEPGSFTVLPLDQVDFRFNTLLIDGIDPLSAAGTDAAPIVKIGAAGDIIPGRNVANYIAKTGNFKMPLQRVKSVLSMFDITFANFECFISETLEMPTGVGILDFLTRPAFVPGLVEAGIDAVSMANNHAVFSHAGWGLPAFADTFAFLNDGGVPVFGAGMDLDQARQPWVGEANGLSVALLGVDGITGNLQYPTANGVVPNANSQATADHGGTNPLDFDTVLADIESLAGQYDIVIPFFHMSDQYIWTPQDWAIETAHRSIDAGASVVISSHPHTIQGFEVYANKPIFHGIGNFIYDQMFSVDTRQGYVLELVFRGSQVIGFRTHPVNIDAFSQPRFLSPAESAAFMDRFWLSTDLRIKTH